MMLALSYQVYEVLDGQVNGLFRGRVQGLLQEMSYKPKLQYLGSTHHITHLSAKVNYFYIKFHFFMANTELCAIHRYSQVYCNKPCVYLSIYGCLQDICDKTNTA